MPTKNPKLEFVNDETKRNLIEQRLQGVEQEVFNASVDLRMEEAIASSYGAEDVVPGPGHPGSAANVAQRQQAYDSAVARLEALRAIREENIAPAAKDKEPAKA